MVKVMAKWELTSVLILAFFQVLVLIQNAMIPGTDTNTSLDTGVSYQYSHGFCKFFHLLKYEHFIVKSSLLLIFPTSK